MVIVRKKVSFTSISNQYVNVNETKKYKHQRMLTQILNKYKKCHTWKYKNVTW